jgi:rod shape determining protein RodA
MNNSIFLRLDWLSLLLYLSLAVFGIVNIYSATYVEGQTDLFNLETPAGKQSLFFLLGLIGGGLILFLNIKIFDHLSTPFYFLMILLLVSLFFFGKTISGARSWFSVGGFGLQPSEFAKIGTALFLAKILSNFQTNLKTPKSLLQVSGILLTPMFLIVLQPDPGSALVYLAFFFVLLREGLNLGFLFVLLAAVGLFLGTLLLEIPVMVSIVVLLLVMVFLLLKKRRYKPKILPFVGIGTLAVAFVFSVNFIFNGVFEQRHRDRFNIILGKTVDTQGIGYNINQSKIAIGAGGFGGKGFLNGTQTKGNFVPAQHTDYIFSTIGEEWGFVGGVIVILLFAALIIRIVYQAEKQTNTFRRAYAYGVASVIFFHFFINTGMALGMVPTIGIPLPFISYGGSSLLAFSLMIFIYLNMDANRLNEW